jgi:tetratricopeptide (TPR) repeat protein
VAKIEEKPTGTTAVMAEYVTRLSAALKSKSADDWHALGLWCRDKPGFRDKAAEAFDRALALDPDHTPTRLLRGDVRLNGLWMSRQEALQAIAPDIEANARLRELEVQKRLEEARLAVLEEQKRSKALEAKIAELRRDIEDLRQRLALPALPPDYFRPRVIYRPYYILPPPRPRPRPPDRKESPKEPSPKEGTTTPPPPKPEPDPDKPSK